MKVHPVRSHSRKNHSRVCKLGYNPPKVGKRPVAESEDGEKSLVEYRGSTTRLLPKPVCEQESEKGNAGQEEGGVGEGWKKKKTIEFNSDDSEDVYLTKSSSLCKSFPYFRCNERKKR